MKKQLAAAILLAFASELGLGKTVGLWKDARSAITDGMIKTLQEAGWQTVILQGRDLSDDAKLDALDALFLPGAQEHLELVGRLLPQANADDLELAFDQPQWAVTPGQSAVLYHGDVCLGGGLIASAQT